MSDTPRSVAELAADLRRLGIQSGDVVMPHASLRKIGPVVGRAAGVVQALDAAVGAEGTVLMNVGPDNSDLFDPLRTPTDPDNGVLAEVFRTTPGTLVTNHPEGRMGARGRLAGQLTRDVPWDDYYGPGSPLERLVELHGKVVRLGADLGTTTLLHYAEYLVPLPGKRRVVRHRRVLDPAGPVVRAVECLDDSDGIFDYGDGDYFEDLTLEYLRTGRARQARVGNASSELIDAADMVEFAVAWMTRRFGQQ